MGWNKGKEGYIKRNGKKKKMGRRNPQKKGNYDRNLGVLGQ
jgi:hypothetical protein